MGCCSRIRLRKKKITELPPATELDLEDLFEMVEDSEISAHPERANVKVTLQQLLDFLIENLDISSTGLFTLGVVDPEGVVTAEPGQGYVNTLLKSIWIKETGTGATGWQFYV